MRSRESSSRITLFCGIAFCLISFNGLINAETCKAGCPHSDNGLLKYAPGSVYEYSVESLMTVGTDATNEAEDITLKLSGQAKLYASGNCGYTLQLDRISVSNAKESIEKQIIQNLNKPIKFTMAGGELSPEICADKSDSVASLNIKRGIISLLQSAEKSHDTDVFGVCPTLTSVSKTGSDEIITKVRNLNACGYREQISNGLINGVVDSKSGIKSSALLKADYSKELRLQNGIPQNIQLVEEYKLAPMTNGAGIAKAKVKTTLRLGNVGRDNAPSSKGEPESIIFEVPAVPTTKNIAVLKKVFANTVDLVNEHVQGDAAQHFTELIRLMRSSDLDSLIELSVVPHANKVLARKVYLDALFRVGTSNAVKAVIRQISKFSEAEKKLAFMSFNLVQSVEKDALNQAATLLNANSPKEAFLAIGNLVNKFCKHGTCDQSEVNVISKKFVESLKHCKANTKKDEDRFVNILKGIRNTHKIADASAHFLAECASADRSARLRVAAIQAFTASACNAGLQSAALNILKDRNEDSELRIEAYLAAVACPNAQLANDIAEIVNSEPVYQVGGFIASHLKAIRDSTDPTREAARHFLGNIRVTKKFPIEANRYSFNSELSYAIDSLGIGASADYSLIYSQKGFLPRAARLNLTSEIFGTNFNVLEISARQENLEELWANFFGPKGALRLDRGNVVNNLISKSRSRRSIVDDADKLAKKYKTYGSKATNDINLDLAIRLFGSEMFFLSLADDVPKEPKDILAKLQESYESIKNSIKDFQHEYACHSLFMDTEFAYPTGMGIPLEISVQGTSATKLSVATNIDIEAILSDPQKTKYHLKFVPSVDVNINGQLGFNALVLKAGLRTSNSLHSSVGQDETFELTNEGGYGFNLDIVFPRENLELIDIKHSVDFVISEQDRETKVVPLKQRKKKNAPEENCFDQLHYIGMTVCFTSVLPDTSESSDLALARPMHVSLRLQTEKKIKLVGSYGKKDDAFTWKLKYSTPGSQVPHDTELKVEAMGSAAKSFVRASVEHPEMRLSAEGGFVNNDKEILLYGQCDVNGEKFINKIGLTKNGNEYRPLIEVQNNNGVSNEINGIRADGRIISQESEKNLRLTFDNLKIISRDNGETVINGWTELKPFKSELKIRHGNEEYDVKSHLSLENGYSAGLFVKEKKSPNSSGASIHLQLLPNAVNDNIVVAIGDFRFEMQNEFEYTRKENKELKETKFKNNLKLKQGKVVHLEATVNGEVRPKLVQFQIDLVKDAKKVAVDFNFAHDQRNAGGDYTLSVNAKLNQHYIDLKSNADIKGAHYVTDSSLHTSWGTQMTAKGEVGQRLTANDVFIDLQGSFVFTPKDKQGTWLLKVIGTPDKTNADFKLTRENSDLVVFSGEKTHPQDKISSGKINLQIKDQLVAKGDFKINKNGKGDLTAVVNLKKSQRKLTVDSKFLIAAPKYDIETTIGYDNDKKIHIKTENVVDKSKPSTKSSLDINGDKYVLEGNAAMKGDQTLNGEIDGKMSITMPSGRQFEGQLSRKMATAKNGIAHGSMSASIHDKLPNNERRSIELNGNLEKLNKKTNEFVANNNLIFTNSAGKKLDLGQKIKHLLKGNFKSIDYSLELGGELLSAPIDISLIVDEYCPKHAIFRVNGKYGDQINANINGNYDMGDRAKPSSYDIKINVAAPQTNLKTYSLASNGKYLAPETENGVRSIDIHFDQKAGDKTLKLNTHANGNNKHGTYSLDLVSSELEAPLKLDASFSVEPIDEKTGKSKYNFNYIYGQKSLKTALDLSHVDPQTVRLHYVLDSTFDASKNNVDLVVNLSDSEDDVAVNTDLQLNAEKYTVESRLFKGEHKKGVTVKAILPQKTTTISGIVEKLGERKGKLVLKIDNLGDLDLDHTGEINLNDITDFYVNSHTNSRKLKIENLDVDIRTSPSNGGKGVEINVKNAKGVILFGSATYVVKHEHTKTIIEGQGQVQYYQKTNNANFKIIHELYDMTKDKEVGSSLTFNGTFGPKNAVSTLKITNKNFHAKLSVCEEKKQCTNVEVRSIITVDPNDISSVQHDLMVLVDLRELGYPHEFELQSKSSRKGLKFSHEIESNIISNSNIKYQLVASMTPELNKFQVKLPSREIYVETEQVLPQNILGHYQSSASFYLDKKNKPNDVTKFIAMADISGTEKVAINLNGELRFENPGMRPLSVKGHMDANYEQRLINSQMTFDVFREPAQKIVASSVIRDNSVADRGQGGFNITSENSVKSSGLGLQYEASGHTALSMDKLEFSMGYNVQSGVADIKSSGLIYGSKERVEIVLNAMDEQMLNMLAEYNSNKHSALVRANMKLLSLKSLDMTAEMDENSAKISLKRPGMIDASAEVKLGKEAKFSLSDGNNKKLVTGRVALDGAHFLSSSLESNDEDLKQYLKSVEAHASEDVKAARQQIQQRFQKVREAMDHQLELLKNSAPDFSHLKASLNDIQKDIANDPAIQEFIENYRKYFETASKIYTDMSLTILEAYKQIAKSVSEIISKMQVLIKETMVPIWEEFAEKVSVLLGDLQAEVLKLITMQLEQLVKSLKSIEPDLKALAKSMLETVKPIAESLQELARTMSKDFEELIKDLKEYMSKLPTFEALRDEIKKKLAELKTVDEILSFLRNIIDQLNSFSASNEFNELAKKLYDYIEAKLRGNNVNDVESLEGIANAIVKLVNSLWKRLADVKAPTVNLLSPVPLVLDVVRNLPTWISFRFSLLNFLMNEKIDVLSDLADLLRPPLPFDLIGHIADGKNIITFDGRQLSFQGSCKYVIAQDSEKNDFSLVGQFKDGKLKSLTLIDSKNYVEISDNGALKLNGKPAEYPIHEDNVHAWRKYYTLRMRNTDSVEVVCTSDLKICHVTVDGIYTSKLRGLLGNGNAEPYDDFINVEGKISPNRADFINDYGLGNCPPVNSQEPANLEHDSVCSELFAFDSSLVLGYLFQNHMPYRQACDEAVLANPENKEETACNIATAYASAAHLQGLPISVPSRCLKCAGAPGMREIGDEFTSKAPTNKADVVFVVDMSSSQNVIENLVTPAISEIRNQLKLRGMTDAQVAVIAFKDDQLYPALLTSNGGKINYNGKLSSVTLNGPQRPEPINIKEGLVNDILNWLEKFERQIEKQSDEAAFGLALEYPFRAGAAKAIVAVRSDQLEYSNALKFLRSHLLAAMTEFEGASLHLISPVKDIGVEGVPTEKLVGFNSRIVATTEGKDAKKRQKLKFKKDMGIDFVLENNGWVFAMQNFDALSGDDQKKAYLNQVTSSISDTLFKTETVSECKCVKSHGLHAEHKCKIVSSNFLPNKRPKGA